MCVCVCVCVFVCVHLCVRCSSSSSEIVNLFNLTLFIYNINKYG